MSFLYLFFIIFSFFFSFSSFGAIQIGTRTSSSLVPTPNLCALAMFQGLLVYLHAKIRLNNVGESNLPESVQITIIVFKEHYLF